MNSLRHLCGDGERLGATRGFLSASEAAAVLGLSSRTVYRMLSRGDLNAVRVGGSIRIPIAELERLPAYKPGQRGRE